MNWFLDRLFDSGPLSFIAGLLIFVGSIIFAAFIVDAAKSHGGRRADLTVQCVAGNENACRIYELDFGR